LSERPQVQKALGEAGGRRGQPDGAGARQLLHAIREMHGRADGVVVHAEIVADRAHQHLARIEADPDAHLDAVGGARAVRLQLHRALDRERRVAGAHRVVLMRDRRAEQRHDPIAQDPVDGALVAVHAVHHHSQRRIQDAPRVLRIGVLDQRERALDVGEQHGDLLALALERVARAEDPLGQMTRGVGRRRGRDGRRRGTVVRAERGDRREQLLAVPERGDAEFLEIVRGEAAQERAIDVVRREDPTVLAETLSLQPGADVHRPSPAVGAS
jgi:hypothetical protein